MKTWRRISQILFLLFFVLLFLQTRYPLENGIPADLFFHTSPLISITTIFASRSFFIEALPGIVFLLLAIPFGRFFCGWICPLGTVIDINDRFLKRKKPGRKERDSVKFRPVKFFILVAILVAALFSLQLTWFFDPIVVLTRVFTLAIYPAFVFLVNSVFDLAFTSGALEDQVYSVYSFIQKTILPVGRPEFLSGIAVVLLFLGILFLGLVSKRFWCRNLCPLGALLGIFSKYRITRRYVASSCTKCARCQTGCKMNAIEDDYSINNTVECIECGDCVAVCPPKAVSYKFGKNQGKNEIDFSRRRLLQAGAVGLTSMALIKTASGKPEKRASVIRPPGALEESAFLDRCVRCQECVRVCSSTGGCLQPALFEAGWEGIWSPISVPTMGYCEFNCNLCSQVCVSGAIQELTLEAKQKLKMGTAHFDKTLCIPWYSQEDCLVCEEHCPVPDKAIKFDIHEARGPDGTMRTVKFPWVDEELCIGCGICENKCPLVGKKGIFVTSAKNERVPAKS